MGKKKRALEPTDPADLAEEERLSMSLFGGKVAAASGFTIPQKASKGGSHDDRRHGGSDGEAHDHGEDQDDDEAPEEMPTTKRGAKQQGAGDKQKKSIPIPSLPTRIRFAPLEGEEEEVEVPNLIDDIFVVDTKGEKSKGKAGKDADAKAAAAAAAAAAGAQAAAPSVQAAWMDEDDAAETRDIAGRESKMLRKLKKSRDEKEIDGTVFTNSPISTDLHKTT